MQMPTKKEHEWDYMHIRKNRLSQSSYKIQRITFIMIKDSMHQEDKAI
jgi:hypothetical protein